MSIALDKMIYEKKANGCAYCGDTSRSFSLGGLEQYIGLVLLGEDSRQEITVEDYKEFCESQCCRYIGAFIINDMSDKTRGRFWNEVNNFKKKYNIEDLLLNECVLLLYAPRETPEQRSERILKSMC